MEDEVELLFEVGSGTMMRATSWPERRSAGAVGVG